MKKYLNSKSGLFMGTFVSALLLIFGLGSMGSVLIPVLITKLSGPFEYQPLLPLAAVRDKEFIDIDSIPSKQLFPALSSPEKVTGGDQILVPAIGVQVPIVMSASIEDKDVLAALKNGVALYPNGILPGRLGNAFVSGHSSGTNVLQGKYPLAFVRANELQPGDLVHMDFAGTRYTYKLTHSRIVIPDPNFRVLSDRPVPTLTLMTCTPLWTSQKRLLQHLELTNITKLTPEQV